MTTAKTPSSSQSAQQHQPAPAPERSGKESWHESWLIYRLTRLIAAPIIPLLLRLQVEGLENIPANGPVILAMNHIHWMDIPLAAFKVPHIIHYMAKIELFNLPILGWYIRRLGAFAVRRGQGDREAIRISEEILTNGNILVIFPEGHRSGNGVLLEAHPGTGYIAMRTGAPVVAVGIAGTQQVFKKFRPVVTIRYSKPFVVASATAKRTRDSVAQATDEIMRQVAALLPPEIRGPYADVPDTDVSSGSSDALITP